MPEDPPQPYRRLVLHLRLSWMRSAELGTAMFVVALVLLVAISDVARPSQLQMSERVVQYEVTEVLDVPGTNDTMETLVEYEDMDVSKVAKQKPRLRPMPRVATNRSASKPRPLAVGGGATSKSGGGPKKKKIYIRKLVRVSTKGGSRTIISSRGRSLTGMPHNSNEPGVHRFLPPPLNYSQAWSRAKLDPRCPRSDHAILGAPGGRLAATSGAPAQFLIQLRNCTGVGAFQQCSDSSGVGTVGDVAHIDGFEVYAWFYGPSMFAGEVRVHDAAKGQLKVVFHPLEPGDYTVRVVEWQTSKWKRNKFCIRPFSPAPLRLTVAPAGPPPPPGAPPSPVPWPAAWCNDLAPDRAPRVGRWLRCTDVKRWYPEEYTGCNRFGWLWVPAACHYRYVPPQYVLAQNLPTWIVVFSSSLLRSVYWYFLDSLGGSKYISLVTWKCWGWMDLQVGNFRVSWRDWRLIGHLAVPENYEKGYLSHFERFMQEILAAKTKPDLYVFETLHLEDEAMLTLTKARLLDAGDANVLFTNVQVGRPDRAGVEAFALRDQVYEQLQRVGRRTARPPGYLDIFTMTYPLLHDLEFPLPQPAKHHQRRCGQHVCALQMDMAGQLLLNAALQRLAAGRAGAAGVPPTHPDRLPANATFVRAATICALCPKKEFVLPFTFAPSAKPARCSDIELMDI